MLSFRYLFDAFKLPLSDCMADDMPTYNFLANIKYSPWPWMNRSTVSVERPTSIWEPLVGSRPSLIMRQPNNSCRRWSFHAYTVTTASCTDSLLRGFANCRRSRTPLLCLSAGHGVGTRWHLSCLNSTGCPSQRESPTKYCCWRTRLCMVCLQPISSRPDSTLCLTAPAEICWTWETVRAIH